MTTLVFPQDAEDWSAAFNNALENGALCNEPRDANFWARHELLASEVEGETITADWFFQRNTSKHLRVPRIEEEGK